MEHFSGQTAVIFKVHGTNTDAFVVDAIVYYGGVKTMMISRRSLISPVPGFKRLKYLIFYINISLSGLPNPERLPAGRQG